MLARFPQSVLILTGCLVVFGWNVAAAADGILLDVTKRQIPDDTGNEDQTTMVIEKLSAFGGNALKVVFGDGDSFGGQSSRVKNWTAYSQIRVDIYNPSQEIIGLELNVIHSRTKDVSTRVIHEISVQPGKQTLRINLRDLENSNGSAPDLANVVRWYIACLEGQTPTLYFGNLVLESRELPASPPAPRPVNAPSSLPSGGA